MERANTGPEREKRRGIRLNPRLAGCGRLLAAVRSKPGVWKVALAALAVLGVLLHFFSGADSGRKEGRGAPLYYQSPMHPWVKSSKPGKCTVCGMDLVPVYPAAPARAVPASPDDPTRSGPLQPGRSMDPTRSEPRSGAPDAPPPGLSQSREIQPIGNSLQPLRLLRVGDLQVAGIRVEPVVRREVLRTIRVPGVVEDDDSRHRILSATVPGRIEKLHVNWEGAEVVEGQPLATFYSPDLGSVVGEYRALARGGAASPALLAAAENRLRQRGLTRAQVERMRTEGGTGLEFEILAPRTGTVTRRHVYEGQYVAEGTRLFELADFSRMWLQFALPEQDLPFVRVGLPVEIRLPSLPGRVFRSEIGFINPNLDPQTRTAKVRVELENPVGQDGKHLGHEILHLSVAMGRIEVGGEALAVPREAVLWTGTGARVYVEKEPGVYERRVVELGRAGDRFWEVRAGLQAGERVVVESNLLLDSQAQLDFSVSEDSGRAIESAAEGELQGQVEGAVNSPPAGVPARPATGPEEVRVGNRGTPSGEIGGKRGSP